MNIAILIDAENVLPAHADFIFDHAASLGEIRRKEIFGAAQALSTWVAPVLKYAIHPNLTIKASKGKNSSDICLVIGAMDLVVDGGIDTVIIASSDSDFSALSVRLRNAGIEVIGMGQEKSNELWRTACSSFVVLQTQKPQPAAQKAQKAASPKAQPAAQKPQPAKPEPAPRAEAPAKPEAQPRKNSRNQKAAPATHAERMAEIRALIEKELASHDGRLQVSNLFPVLNKLAAYRVDKQGASKKPLNYLTSTYGDAFHFEETPDGQNWVSLLTDEAAPAPEAEVAVEPEAVAAPEAEPVAAEPAAVEPEPAEANEAENVETEAAVVEVEAPAEAEPEAAVEVPEVEAVEPAPAGEPDEPLARLIAAGLPEDVAGQIVVIFTESESLRAAYNRLRSTFGNTAGREYYQKVKEIAEAQ